MWSMWNAPSDRDYYDSLGADWDEDQAEVCGDCGARWDLEEACEDWCATNRPVPEPVPDRHEEDDDLFLANSLLEDLEIEIPEGHPAATERVKRATRAI